MSAPQRINAYPRRLASPTPVEEEGSSPAAADKRAELPRVIPESKVEPDYPQSA